MGLLGNIRNNRKHGSCPRKMVLADKMSSDDVIRQVELWEHGKFSGWIGTWKVGRVQRGGIKKEEA